MLVGIAISQEVDKFLSSSIHSDPLRRLSAEQLCVIKCLLPWQYNGGTHRIRTVEKDCGLELSVRA